MGSTSGSGEAAGLSSGVMSSTKKASCGMLDRVAGIERAVGLELDNELVEIGALLDARAFDHVRHPAHRREGRVQKQLSDGPLGVFLGDTGGRRVIPTTLLHRHAHVELTRLGKVGDDVIGVHDFDVVVDDDVARVHRAGTFLINSQNGLFTGVHANSKALQVQQYFGDVFLHALDGRVFVKYALDIHLGNGASRHRGQQHASQGIAEGVAESAIQWLDDNLRCIGANFPHVYDAGAE